ncbi:unnamed protein product [Clonostachys byssicola]|uniref:Autophagy-related protein 1 n=1 Tax=Clonostachys byssicola TaxID=160290 RepID=A0A9N9UE27_9HYPO|nr:unnamed protein product [Clonostachys byssicola]
MMEATEQDEPFRLQDDSDSYTRSAVYPSSDLPHSAELISGHNAPAVSSVYGNSDQPRNEFLNLVTTISQAYRRRRYIKMRGVNNVPFVALAEGSDFQVSQPIEFALSHSQGISRTKEIVVIKQSVRNAPGRPLKPADMSKIALELRILDHFHNHENIVSLRGVGWFYENSYDNALTPCAQPALLLEHAQGTLSTLLRSWDATSVEARLFLCRDVTMGLKALQEAGVGHGDLKPANILIFAHGSSTDHAPMAKYYAKISDFSQARLADTTTKRRLGGTFPYLPPERDEELSATEVQAADVWSLGVLFAATLFDQELDANPMRLRRESDFDGELLGESIKQASQQQFHQSTLESFWHQLWTQMFAYTLQKDAQDRAFIKLCESMHATFTDYLQRIKRVLVDHQNSHVARLKTNDALELFISYEGFKPVSNQVKDMVESELLAICDGPDSPLRATACFELAVVLLSAFARPCTDERTRRGLSYLYQAAELGDLRAKALGLRLTISFRVERLPDYDDERLQKWQREAVASGHSILMQDIDDGDTYQASGSLDGIDATSILTDQLDLHEAAASGNLAALENSIKNHSLDEKNSSGETALIVAARSGQVPAILRLLHAGADPSLCDSNNANILHHAWCYQGPFEGVRDVLQFCRDRNYSDLFFQSADGLLQTGHLSLYPTPPGTPLERAVAKSKIRLVDLFLTIMPRRSPLNGVILRRALLLAFKFCHVAIQERLISYACQESASEHRLDKPLWNTMWDFRGAGYTYMDAIVVGTISGDGQGVDLPIDFWRRCCLGKEAVDRVLESLVRLIYWGVESSQGDKIPREKAEEMLDKAIKLALVERSYDAVEILLAEKGEITLGVHNRCLSIRHLAWRSILAPFGPLSELLHEDWMRRRDLFLHAEPDLQVNYIDQIFHDSEGRTLAQQAILNGDRTVFQILIRHFGADLRLPAPLSLDFPIDTVPHGQMNLYSLIARSEQFDWWFAEEAWSLKIPISWPLLSPTATSDLQLPPLYHALGNHFWAMSFWLFRNGATMLDEVTKGIDLLELLLSPQFLDVKIMGFLFPPLPDASHDLLPEYFQNDPQYWMFQYLQKAKLFAEPYRAGAHRGDRPNTFGLHAKDSYKAIGAHWKILFESHHPGLDRANTVGIYFPSGDWRPIIRRHCIFRQALSLGWETLEDTIKSYQENGNFPRQSWSSLLIGSPLDDMSFTGMGKSDLWQDYWYLPSIWHRLFQQCVSIAICILLVIYTSRTVEFRWPRQETAFEDILLDFKSTIILIGVVVPAGIGVVVAGIGIRTASFGDSSDDNGRKISNHPVHAFINGCVKMWFALYHRYLSIRYLSSVEDCDEYVLGSQYQLLARQSDFTRRKI